MSNKNKIALVVVLIAIILFTGGFFLKKSNDIKKENTSNILLPKENIEKKQTWHTEGDEKYVDDEYNFSAQYPKGWFLEESLPVGPNEGGWKRRISFSNYSSNDERLSNLPPLTVPDDYKIFEFILDKKENCEKALKNGYKITTDINVWKKSFDNIRAMAKDYPQLSATKMFQFEDLCFNVYAFLPENNGKNVTAKEKIDIIRGFAQSVQFQE